jgi:hypothetical protein
VKSYLNNIITINCSINGRFVDISCIQKVGDTKGLSDTFLTYLLSA